MQVFVLDKKKRPLMPCHPARARELLRQKRAVVHRLVPFTIRLKDRLLEESVVQPVVLGIDPGSKTTGLALAREEEADKVGSVRHTLWLSELHHRGAGIRKALQQRAACRRRRRSANLRHRAPRFLNRRRPEGWLPPGLRHRLDTTLSWVSRLRRWAPVQRIVVERVRFDTQLLAHPEISGVEYQQGELQGYEVREYVLEKWGRACVHCSQTDVPFQVDHVVPKKRGGSDRVSNLVPACRDCNEAKSDQPIEVFLANKPALLTRILAGLKQPLRDVAAVNATRWALWRTLVGTGVPVEAASGGRTKWNRSRLGLPKTHALDALCVGILGTVHAWRHATQEITATGRGSHQRTNADRSGFPHGFLARTKTQFGFRTGDLVRAVVPTGKHRGTHTGHVALRASGSFNLRTATGLRQGIGWHHFRLVQRADGYRYAVAPPPSTSAPEVPTSAPPRPERRGIRTRTVRSSQELR